MKNAAKTEEDLGSKDTCSVEGQGAPICGVDPHLGFSFGTRDNFTVIVDGAHLGAQNGRTVSGQRFESAESERSWIAWQLSFQRHFLERLERYAGLRLAELAAAEVPKET